MAAGFFDAMLRRPGWVLIAYSVILAAALAQLSKIRLDASSDSLLLQGDPDLAYFRESAEKYSGDEFLILTWEPGVPPQVHDGRIIVGRTPGAQHHLATRRP